MSTLNEKDLRGMLMDLYTNKSREFTIHTGMSGKEYFHRFIKLELIKNNSSLFNLVKEYYHSNDPELLKLGDELIENELNK